MRRRLERAGSGKSVHDFRIEQVQWGLVAFAVAAAYGLVRTLGDPSAAVSSAVLCVIAFVVGVLARDNRLSSQVKARERRIVAEFPTLAELLALAVGAGEGPVGPVLRGASGAGGAPSGVLTSAASLGDHPGGRAPAARAQPTSRRAVSARPARASAAVQAIRTAPPAAGESKWFVVSPLSAFCASPVDDAHAAVARTSPRTDPKLKNRTIMCTTNAPSPINLHPAGGSKGTSAALNRHSVSP